MNLDKKTSEFEFLGIFQNHSYSIIIYLIIITYHVNSLMVLSAPQLNTHGSVGWNVTPKIPKSEHSSCSLSNFNGTTRGF